MSELGRVKKSCEPCRKRKSRCNDEIPCQSCILRGTQASCNPNVPRIARFSPYDRPVSTPRPGLDQIRASLVALEETVKTLQQSEADVDAEESLDSDEHKANWIRMTAVLPSTEAMEILLEFLHQECDWLYFHPKVIPLWQRAFRHRAVSTPTAGLLCGSLATAALLIGPHRQSLYRPQVDTTQLHTTLYKLALEFIEETEDVASLSHLDQLLAICFYGTYTGNIRTLRNLVLHVQSMFAAAEKTNFLDESSIMWENTTAEERNHMRQTAESIIMCKRWSTLTPGPYSSIADIPTNVCRPNRVRANLRTPISVDGSEPDTEGTHFRVLRLRGSAERQRSSMYPAISFELTAFFTRITTLAAASSASDAERSRALLGEMMAWKEDRLIGNGFGLIGVEHINPEDHLSCLALAQSVYLHHAFYCVLAIFLRPWLADPRINPTHTERFLQQACLDNAEAVMNTIPHIKLLVASGRAPIILPWLASNLFNAAINFAIPVLRAVKHNSPHEKDEAVRRLLVIPSTFQTDPWLSPIGDQAAAIPQQPVPIEVLQNFDVWRCAKSMLTILDGMSVLNHSPFSVQAQARLEELIQQTGLRQTEAMLKPPFTDLNGGLPNAPLPGSPVDGLLGRDTMDEGTLLEELLQDPAIWEQLAAYSVSESI
ncbi:hypothetical protein BD324DRAFT_21867 [Kockovaella imperatae]|uniref:Zn(2)-C6 fungal-type domain-containing protein n=1 Tax=Kockovaella imperatae TaxID=4999 RepID=A0A1Y1URZ0_9TREE|nr:hypothetical protein BD324DRAFT_21867 [Kockovaella imperatae]ORX40800.1 hypothetical protein BD324DRAFT_21867 [Kockovaella imperatae]